MTIFKEDSDSNIFTYNFKTYNLVSTRDVSVLGTDSRYHRFLGLGTGIENRCYKVGTSTFTCFILRFCIRPFS